MPHSFAVPQTPAQYNALKSDNGFAAWDEDDLFEFDDAGSQVLIHGVYRELGQSSTRRTLRNRLGLQDPEVAIENFATQAYKDKIVRDREEARDQLREVADQAGPAAPAPAIDPAHNGAQAGGNLLDAHGGMVLGYDHKDQPSKEMMTDLIKQGTVRHVFVEEFPIELQADVDAYLNSPSAEQSPALKKHLGEMRAYYNVDFEPMLIAAREQGVKIHGINSVEADPGVATDDPRYHERRVVMMNAVAKRVFDEVRANNPGEPFVALTGHAHVNTVEGGIPGLAQIMNVPGVTYDKSAKKLIPQPEDFTKRGMPNPLEMQFVEAALVKAKGEYAVLLEEVKQSQEYRDAEPKPKLNSKLTAVEVTTIAKQLAGRFTDGGQLNEPARIPTLLADPAFDEAFQPIYRRTLTRQQREQDLKKAVAEGDLDTLRDSLNADPYLLEMAVDEEFETNLLHTAAEAGHADLVEELLARGLDPNRTNRHGQTALHLALGKEVPLDKQDAVAATVGRLLAQGGNAALPNPEGKTALDLARTGPAGGGRMMSQMVAAGNATFSDLFVARFVDDAKQAYGRVKAQGEASLDEAETRESATRLAAQLGDDVLTSREAVAEAMRRQEVAAEIRRLIEVTQLRRGRVDELKEAIDAGDLDSLRALLDADPVLARTEIRGKMPLAHAVVLGQMEIVDELVDHRGVDLEQRSERGRTALLELCSQEIGKEDRATQLAVTQIAASLIAKGADINARNRGGETALHQAGFRDNAELVGVLSDMGADPSIKDARGWTAFDMTLGSTNKAAEQVFYDTGMAEPDSPIDTFGGVCTSTVDILCQATLCNNPAQEAAFRANLETLYADPTMRPMLDLAAAAACNPRDPPTGGLRIFVSDRNTVGALFGQSIGPSGAYDEKVNTLLVPMASDQQEKDPIGTLAHEMTHLAAHLVTNDEATMPFEDEEEKQRYIEAIEEDLKRLHLLDASNDAEQFVFDRFTGRMGEYADRGGDTQLLQEYLVGVPQLIAVYGIEFVEKHVPNLAAYYRTFTERCAEVYREDERFARGRATISAEANTAMIDRLARDDAGPPSRKVRDKLDYEAFSKPGSGTLLADKESEEEQVQALIDRIRTDYIVKNGAKRAVAGREVAYQATDFELPEEELTALDAKLAEVKKALISELARGDLPVKVSADGVRDLISVISDTCRDAEQAEVKSVVERRTRNWVKNEKIAFVDFQIARNNSLDADQLAEAIAYRTEAAAHGDGRHLALDTTVNEKKQKALIKNLSTTLSKEEYRAKLDDPTKLIDTMAAALSVDANRAHRQGTDPNRVVIDKSRSKMVWLRQLKMMP